MTRAGSVYGKALYALALEEGLAEQILGELTVLKQSFRLEPGFLRLLSSPSLSRQERCQILNDSFRGRLQPYVLNFLKILTEKGYLRHFSDCCAVYEESYNRDNGILPVTAITAVALDSAQAERLTGRLSHVTSRQIKLTNKVDPSVLGGVRLELGGKHLDDTVSHRMDTIRRALHDTVL